jgi:hypothetical protein
MSPFAVVSRLVRPSKFRSNFIGRRNDEGKRHAALDGAGESRPHIAKDGKFHAKIEEFHLTAAEPHPA